MNDDLLARYQEANAMAKAWTDEADELKARIMEDAEIAKFDLGEFGTIDITEAPVRRTSGDATQLLMRNIPSALLPLCVKPDFSASTLKKIRESLDPTVQALVSEMDAVIARVEEQLASEQEKAGKSYMLKSTVPKAKIAEIRAGLMDPATRAEGATDDDVLADLYA